MGNEIQNFFSEKKINLEFMGGPVLSKHCLLQIYIIILGAVNTFHIT